MIDMKPDGEKFTIQGNPVPPQNQLLPTLFDLNQDVLAVDGNMIGNFYGLGVENNDRWNPFLLWKTAYGDSYIEAMAASAYSEDSNVDWDTYRSFLNAGICTGFSAMTAIVHDDWRLRGGQRMCQRAAQWETLLKSAVTYHSRVLTWPLIKHYKYYMTRDWPETYASLCEYFNPDAGTLLISFVPHLLDRDLPSFFTRLNEAHTVLVKGMVFDEMNDCMALGVWDPNMPFKDDIYLRIAPDGSFMYLGYFDGGSDTPTIITSAPETYMEDGKLTQMGSMLAVPVPVEALRNREGFAGRWWEAIIA